MLFFVHADLRFFYLRIRGCALDPKCLIVVGRLARGRHIFSASGREGGGDGEERAAEKCKAVSKTKMPQNSHELLHTLRDGAPADQQRHVAPLYLTSAFRFVSDAAGCSANAPLYLLSVCRHGLATTHPFRRLSHRAIVLSGVSAVNNTSSRNVSTQQQHNCNIIIFTHIVLPQHHQV